MILIVHINYHTCGMILKIEIVLFVNVAEQNRNSNYFLLHKLECFSAISTTEKNRISSTCTRENLR